MMLYHTSPDPITKITTTGLYGSGLCFSADPYSMSAGTVITYSIELNDDDIIDANELFYHDDAKSLAPLSEHVARVLDCDIETAEELIAQRVSAYDIDTDDPAEDGWWLQRCAIDAAKLLGYRAVSMQDEQGSLYLINMLGRENELKIISGE